MARQIELYEAVAVFAPTPTEARKYRGIAAGLKKLMRRQRLLRLDFKRGMIAQSDSDSHL